MWNFPLDRVTFWGVVAAAVALLVMFVLRSRTVTDPRVRAAILVLRGLVVAAVAAILADPVGQVLVKTPPETKRHMLLVDTSESMGLGRPESRLDIARKVFAPLFPDRLGNLAAFAFDKELRPLRPGSFPDKAPGDGTLLGAALTRALQEAAHAGIADIVVVSDGRIHDEPQLGEALRLARRRAIPISAFIPDAGQCVFNLGIENCMLERNVPPNTRVPVRVLVRGVGTAGRRSVLALTAGDGRPCVSVPFTARDGLTPYELYLDVGDRSDSYTLSLSWLPGEITDRDNRYEFRVEVTSPKLRVIYVEGTWQKLRWDRWEHEFIERALQSDGSIEVDTFYVDDQWSTAGHIRAVKDPARGFPASREELFGFDVVIVSDVNRHIISDEQKQLTVELVAERGGGFCMIGGHTSFGAGEYEQTIWEQLIPVDMELVGGVGAADETFRIKFLPEARNHPILRISPDARKNNAILDALPFFLGTNFVRRAKPGATVLAIHERRGQPEICVQSYGKGRSMAFVSDSTDMWGRYFETSWGEGINDNRYFTRFWINAVRWLGENSAARRQTRLLGNTERVSYRPAETVNLTARVMAGVGEDDKGDAHEDGRAVRITARWDQGSDRAAALTYRESRKEYVGSLTVPAATRAAELRILFRAETGGTLIGEDVMTIRIMEDRREFLDPESNPALLEELARITGGRILRSTEEIAALLRTHAKTQATEQAYRVPRWDRTWLWGVVLGLLTLEWLLRRMTRA